MFGKRWCLIVIVAAAIPGGATTAAADKAAADQPAADKTATSKTAAATPGQQPAGDDTSSKDDPPSCMRCGATCGLRPACVCTPGTKTVPEPEFSTTCAPICIPGCGSRPWPWCRHGVAPGCTSCTDCVDEPCDCPGRIRQRKVLARKTVDAEKTVLNHSVGQLCCRCDPSPRPRSHACHSQAPARGTWRRCLDWVAGLWRH